MPPRPQTLTSYADRLGRALRLMAARLDEDLPIERLADAAALSPYHFHRVWTAIMGETVAETRRRIRMQRAAADLLRGRLPLPRVARRAGYADVASFGRAFRAAYGIAPTAYRARGGIGVLPAGNHSEGEDVMYEVAIRPFEGVRVAAMRHVGDYQEIGAVFDRLMAWASARGLAGARTFGVYHDDPSAVPAAKLRSDACVEVGPGVAGDGAVTITEIPACRAAVLVFRGPYAELERPYRWLYGEWLPRSGEEPADRPCFEEYLNDPKALPPSEWLTALHLPLRG
jgi:AraC family transcriptional regulator